MPKRTYSVETMEKRRAYTKAWQEKNRQHISEYGKMYGSLNKTEILQKKREYREKNREEILAKKSAYNKKNRAARTVARREWRNKNLAHARAYTASRDRLLGGQLIAKKYFSEIKQIYADCPVGCQVDHIVPLRGKTVCGLHVPWNLQYLLAEENIKKGNKLIEDLTCHEYVKSRSIRQSLRGTP